MSKGAALKKIREGLSKYFTIRVTLIQDRAMRRTQKKLSKKVNHSIMLFAFKKPVAFLPIQNLQHENLVFYEKAVVQGFSLTSKLRRSKTCKKISGAN